MAVEEKVDLWQTSSKRKALRNWLSAPNPESNYQKAAEQYYDATCLWFIEGERFRAWLSNAESHRHLWLRGIPGSGKTLLSAKVISLLREKQEAIPLYFFFDFNDITKQTLESMLRSLISQLHRVSKNAKKILETTFSEQFEEGERLLSLSELTVIVLEMVRTDDRVFKIVIDALDECATREAYFHWIQAFTSAASNVSFLITSRDERGIEVGMKSWLAEENFVTIHHDLVTRDIIAYIDHRLSDDSSFETWRLRPDISSKIQQAIGERAGGM